MVNLMWEKRVLPMLRRWRNIPVIAYGIAVLTVLIATGARAALGVWVGTAIPFTIYFPAVVVTTFLAGLWPGILASLLSALAAWYFFLPPPYSSDDALSLGVFLIVALFNVALIHFLNNAIDRIEQLAEQQNVLFEELRHRISNNLQLVSSLLTLRQGAIDDLHARQALVDVSQQLAFIGKLHRYLNNPSAEAVDLGKFLDELCRDILAAGGARHIDCEVKAELMLPSEQSIPLGLITAELISNALEHGFSGRAQGKIRIDIAREGEEAVLTLSDDGHGLPRNFNPTGTTTLGLRIINALSQQLAGRMEFVSGRGTTFRLTFPLMENAQGG
jgi:two-component sensor histidine kinase